MEKRFVHNKRNKREKKIQTHNWIINCFIIPESWEILFQGIRNIFEKYELLKAKDLTRDSQKKTPVRASNVKNFSRCETLGFFL